MNKFIISLVSVGVLSVGFLAWAVEDTNQRIPRPTHVTASPTVRVKMQDSKNQLRQNIQDSKIKAENEIKEEKARIKNTAETVKEDLKKRKEEFNDAVKVRREEFNNTVKTKREELQNEIKSKREDLKVRLEKIKDERKKETVEKIDQRMDALNEKMMRHFSDVLDKLEKMLVRINERVDKASAERDLDVSAIRLSIDKANTAIASARSAIESQSGKTYTIKITTESGLKKDVGNARQALGVDLSKIRDAVKSAHSAVKDVAVALAELVEKPKISPSPSVSSSPVTPVE